MTRQHTDLNRAAEILAAYGHADLARAVVTATDSLDAVNGHRRAAERARERAAEYAQACAWLRRRVEYLERL